MALVLHIREFVNNISMVIIVYRINGYISFIIVIISRMFIFIAFFFTRINMEIPFYGLNSEV